MNDVKILLAADETFGVLFLLITRSDAHEWSLKEFLLVLRWWGARFHNQSACRDEDLLILLIT